MSSEAAYRLYWGDLHNHCGISYAHGSLSRALACARGQLDFCAVTGHAFWPDLPTDRSRYATVIDAHQAGFTKLARLWPQVQETTAAWEEPGRFIPFLSYEWHSLADGDHHIVYRDRRGPLVGGESVEELKANVGAGGRAALVIPHHIGYPQGGRGINWRRFTEQLSPFIEVYSLHGCAESDRAPYPFLHTMGPRDGTQTTAWGLAQGHRFGLVASTDHHAGYPGSYPYGRMAVWATDLTREALWEAFLARRVYAVTGDQIRVQFHVNGAWPGEEMAPATARELDIAVEGWDALDRVEVLRNGRVLVRLPGVPVDWSVESEQARHGPSAAIRAKVRVEWGWAGRDELTQWEGRLTLEDGRLIEVHPCFSGGARLLPLDPAAVAAESDTADLIPPEEAQGLVPHRLLAVDARSCAWVSETTGNATVRHADTQALVADVEVPLNATLHLDINGLRIRHTLAELLAHSRAHYTAGWRTPAVLVHQAVPQAVWTSRATLQDEAPAGDHSRDYYQVRVAQCNGQWAWLSPIWVQR